jgi:hypothetical protein
MLEFWLAGGRFVGYWLVGCLVVSLVFRWLSWSDGWWVIGCGSSAGRLARRSVARFAGWSVS